MVDVSFSSNNDYMCVLLCWFLKTVLTFSISVSADYCICHLLTIHLKDVGLIQIFVAIGMTRVIAHVNSCYLGDVERVIFSKILQITKGGGREKSDHFKNLFQMLQEAKLICELFWEIFEYQLARILQVYFDMLDFQIHTWKLNWKVQLFLIIGNMVWI